MGHAFLRVIGSKLLALVDYSQCNPTVFSTSSCDILLGIVYGVCYPVQEHVSVAIILKHSFTTSLGSGTHPSTLSL